MASNWFKVYQIESRFCSLRRKIQPGTVTIKMKYKFWENVVFKSRVTRKDLTFNILTVWCGDRFVFRFVGIYEEMYLFVYLFHYTYCLGEPKGRNKI